MQFGIEAPWTNRLHSQASLIPDHDRDPGGSQIKFYYGREDARPLQFAPSPGHSASTMKKLANAFTLQVFTACSRFLTEHFVLFSLVIKILQTEKQSPVH